MQNDPDSVESIANLLGVSPSTIYRWVGNGKLVAYKQNGKLSIPIDEDREFILSKLREKRNHPSEVWIPEGLEDYNEWHQVVDYFCWLLKVCYSSKEEIKRKAFRLDKLFANYLRINKVTLQRTRSAFLSNPKPNTRVVAKDLKRGWYNELSYSFPVKKSTLGLSFRDINLNLQTSAERFLFPSWRIITAYYAFYFYLRGLAVLKQPSFRLQEHGATISAFKNNLLSPLGKAIWRFPFDIAYNPGARVYRRELMSSKVPHLMYRYSFHPRTPNRSPARLYEYIYQIFRRRSRSKGKPSSYLLFDFFHDFRVWANYLDIDNLLSLWGTGYKTFLDQNLSTIIFFVGGISELCFISVFGEDIYLAQLQGLHDVFAANVPKLEAVFTKTPILQRLQIYNALGLIKGSITLPQRPDLNAIQIN